MNHSVISNCKNVRTERDIFLSMLFYICNDTLVKLNLTAKEGKQSIAFPEESEIAIHLTHPYTPNQSVKS